MRNGIFAGVLAATLLCVGLFTPSADAFRGRRSGGWGSGYYAPSYYYGGSPYYGSYYTPYYGSYYAPGYSYAPGWSNSYYAPQSYYYSGAPWYYGY